MKRFIFSIVFGVLLIGLLAVWWKNGTSAVNPYDTVKKTFIIQKGQGVREIANNLKDQKLINDPIVFFILIKQKQLDGKIQAGSYVLSPSLKPETILETLTVGTQDVWVTIPEGKRAEEIAEILKENIPTYEENWKEILKNKEGYLFPDTYLFPKESTIDLILSTLTNTFEAKYQTIAPQSKWSKEEVVNIAALIERETKHPEDRPLVASVIENRLDLGMALQIDATVQYALGYDPIKKTWWRQVTPQQIRNTNSPFNTYLNPGLPPEPIANPGLSSLEAAAHPANTNYLYYFTDKNGVNRYSKSLEEHNKQIAQYGL